MDGAWTHPTLAVEVGALSHALVNREEQFESVQDIPGLNEINGVFAKRGVAGSEVPSQVVLAGRGLDNREVVLEVLEHRVTPKVTERLPECYLGTMSKWEYILFDLECDGFKPKQIWVICMVDLITREKESFVGPDRIAEAIARLQAAKLLVGHNIKTFDIRVIEKITEDVVAFDRDKVLDTLYLSKALVKMDNHKLEGWGEILGLPKMDTPFSFYRYDPRMVPYCERDVELNLKVFDALLVLMEHRHGNKIPPKWQMLTEWKAEAQKV